MRPSSVLFLISLSACTSSPEPTTDGGGPTTSDASVIDAHALEALDARRSDDARMADDARTPDDAPVVRDVRALERVTMFALNTQEFVHVEQGRRALRAVVALHEETGVPIDVYLTDTLVALLEDARGDPSSPDRDLLDRLLTSPAVTLGYHTRPPKPYRTGYDWRGDLAEMATNDPSSLRALVTDYEHHVTDLALGTPTTRSGGYAHLATLAGAPPIVVGVAADGPIQRPVREAFAAMGATFFVSHEPSGVSFGDRVDGLWLRPEHVDLPLIAIFEPEHAAGGCPQTWDPAWADGPEALLDDALSRACEVEGARPPCVVGVKMHDNDFFACDSAWATIYLARGVFLGGPPFPLDAEAALLSSEEQARRWDFYERIVRHAASLTETPAVSITDFARAM